MLIMKGRSAYTWAASRLFSGTIEESLRLRFLGLATFWLVAASLAWVGGSPWTWLGGGIAATCGHAFSWYRRRRTQSLWSGVLVVMVIGLAVIMQEEILVAFDGSWLPMAHFLLLVHAIATFDLRTRGGLYAGLALSGIVLFFASQQAFELSFGVFLLGYAALLMAFLAAAHIQDESVDAGVLPAGRGVPLLGFWTGAAGVVLLFSVAAFLLLPRGDTDSVGYGEASVLPITGDPGGNGQPAVGDGPRAPGGEPSDKSSEVGTSPDSERPGEGGTSGEALDQPSEGSEGAGGQEVVRRSDDIIPGPAMAPSDGVVMHVRSPVASYWRGRVFDAFDGRTWTPDETSVLGISGRRSFVTNAVRYTQTFFTPQAQPEEVYMGYQGLEVISPEGPRSRKPFGNGFSYRVVSAQPDLNPEKLRLDRPGLADASYRRVPSSMDWLEGLARRVTDGSRDSFGKAVDIVEHLRHEGRYDLSVPDQLRSSASMEELLLDGEAGTSVDFATATVLLARAAGLPARLATGYLPGERDLLSGAYRVEREDAHAWAEILFRDHGWVPFDGTPSPDLPVGGRVARGSQIDGLKYLFESSVGDDLVRGALLAPAKVYSGLGDAFDSPASAGLVVAVVGSVLTALAWLGIRFLWRRRTIPDKMWPYSKLSGGGRDEMVRVYRSVEKLLRNEGVLARRPGQTLGEYALLASQHLGRAEEHLHWLTEATQSAAYDPAPFPPHALPEARARLVSLKAALG